MYLNLKINKATVSCCMILIITLCFSVIYSGFVPQVETVSTSETTIKLPIIMYHSISKDTKQQGKYVIDPQKLEDDLKKIKEKGYTTIIVQDLINYIEKAENLPEKPIILTFDDGYFNNYLYAYPLLKKYECKAVISPIAYYSEQYSNTSEALSASYSHCTWQQLEEMQKSGYVELQNHSYNLHSQNERLGIQQKTGENDADYREVVVKDLSQAQDLFKSKLNYTPTAFVYPFGVMSNTSEEIIKDMNFKCTIICEERVNHLSRDKNSLYMLGRFLRTNDMTSDELFANFE